MLKQILWVLACSTPPSLFAIEPASAVDLILHRGKIATVDEKLSIQEAIAIRDGRILRVGANDEILALKSDETKVVDLAGKLVIPGLIDSHVHPNSAAMHEFDHEIPEMNSVTDVLAYVRQRSKALGPGKWIEVRQVFITRLQEQRYPTREELDDAAPENPVVFATGPDASLNSLALKESGIDRNFQVAGRGLIEKDPSTGEPTGILRSCTRYVKSSSSGKTPTDEDRLSRLAQLLHDYNSVGITAIADRDASADDVNRYRQLLGRGDLPVRVSVSRHVGGDDDLDSIKSQIAGIAKERERLKSSHSAGEQSMLQIVGIKTYLDGGMLTGSAYLREPWGVSKIYGITDPRYRGVLFIEPEKLAAMVAAVTDAGLQFTAHSVGDAATETLIAAYEKINERTPVAPLRHCVTHANFQSPESIAKAVRLGVVMDIQPVWLYLDAKTLLDQFGDGRLRYFQPLKTLLAQGVVIGGGSDHMQKIGPLRSVNLYHPLLGIQTAVTRRAKNLNAPLHPEEALSREQALTMYTRNNAFVIFRETQIGSIEPGKLADLVILDRDILTCPAEEILQTRVVATYLGGKQVWPR